MTQHMIANISIKYTNIETYTIQRNRVLQGHWTLYSFFPLPSSCWPYLHLMCPIPLDTQNPLSLTSFCLHSRYRLYVLMMPCAYLPQNPSGIPSGFHVDLFPLYLTSLLLPSLLFFPISPFPISFSLRHLSPLLFLP